MPADFVQQALVVQTLAKLERLIRRVSSSSLTYGELASECLDVQERFTDELEARVFLLVDNDHAAYYKDFV